MDARTLAEIEDMVRRNLASDPAYYDAYKVTREVADAYAQGYADALDAEYGTEDDDDDDLAGQYLTGLVVAQFDGQPEQSDAVYTVMDEETHRLRRMSRAEIEELRGRGAS